jgi:hypothetical protein
VGDVLPLFELDRSIMEAECSAEEGEPLLRARLGAGSELARGADAALAMVVNVGRSTAAASELVVVGGAAAIAVDIMALADSSAAATLREEVRWLGERVRATVWRCRWDQRALQRGPQIRRLEEGGSSVHAPSRGKQGRSGANAGFFARARVNDRQAGSGRKQASKQEKKKGSGTGV